MPPFRSIYYPPFRKWDSRDAAAVSSDFAFRAI
jgi:hypothetical protein